METIKERTIEAYTYLRETSKYDRELCIECMKMLKKENQLHYLLEMEGLSMYEIKDIHELLNEKDISTRRMKKTNAFWDDKSKKYKVGLYIIVISLIIWICLSILDIEKIMVFTQKIGYRGLTPVD